LCFAIGVTPCSVSHAPRNIHKLSSEFGFGEETPNAIRDFLAYAYHNWTVSPRYVVLLGDGNLRLQGSVRYRQEEPGPTLPSDDDLSGDGIGSRLRGGQRRDILPDLAIGRLPAATLEELEKMVAGILAWETAGYSFGGRTVLVADNPDQAGDFVADAEHLAKTVLNGQELKKIYLNQLGTAATRREIQQAFNEGSSLMNYIGHGS
jgi:hypothetical protein